MGFHLGLGLRGVGLGDVRFLVRLLHASLAIQYKDGRSAMHAVGRVSSEYQSEIRFSNLYSKENSWVDRILDIYIYIYIPIKSYGLGHVYGSAAGLFFL